MNTSKTDIFETLHEFAVSVSFISDSTLIFAKVKELLIRHIDCEEILLFLDDRERSCLTAPYPLNPTRKLKDLIIPYKDSLVKNILIDRKSFVRTKSDERLFPEYNAELFVPLVSPEDTLGFIYLARGSSEPFTADDIKLVEFASTYITTPLEKSEWEERLLRSQSALQKWQEKYISLIDALPYPAAVIDFEDNKITEVNEGFVSLTGKDFQQIYAAQLDEILEIEGIKSYHELAAGEQYNLWLVHLKKSFPCTFSPLEAQEKSIKLLTITDNSQKAQADKGWNQLLFDWYRDVDPSMNVAEVFSSAIPLFSKIFNSGYFTLHSVTRDNRLLLDAAFLFKGEYHARPNDHVIAAINEGPVKEVIGTQKPLYVADIYADPAMKEWLPIARRVGYRSLVSIPLNLGSYGTAIFSVFTSDPVNWDEATKSWLNNVAQIAKEIISRHHLLMDLRKRTEQIDVLAKLTKEINSKLDFQSVIKTAALEMRKVFQFDYFSIILFDDEGKDDQVFDLAVSQVMDMLGPDWGWQPIEESDLGWVVRPEGQFEQPSQESERPTRMPFSLPSHTSVLLLSGDNYLGNCALGRLEHHAFLQPELQFLRQVAGQIATAIKNSRLYGQTETRLNEISTLAKVSRTISETLDVSAILRITGDAARESLYSSDTKILQITDRMLASELFYWFGPGLNKKLSGLEIDRILQVLEEKNHPFVIDTPHRFAEHFELSDVPIELFEEFKPFIMAPIMRETTLFACIVALTDLDPTIQEHDLDIINALRSQAQNAIAKADLFQRSIQKAEELESFVYSVSHELKTPILTVQSFASLLKEEYDKILPPQASKYLDRISVNLSQMQTLIMDLLELSRIGRSGIKFQEFQSREAVDQAIESLSGLLKEYPTEIIIEEPLPRVFAHAGHLTRLFSNLISNAVKYSRKKKSPTVKIGCIEGRSNYEFYVEDNGVGIPEELLDRIFDLFHTVNENDDELSTGVGLTIVKKIVELHKGTIKVESKLGKGSTFRFTIPKKQPG